MNHLLQMLLLSRWPKSILVLGIFLSLLSSCSNDTDNSPPEVNDASITIEENLADGTVVFEIEAIDPDMDALFYNIIDGNLEDAFDISAQGIITINNSPALDFEMYPQFDLIISVSDREKSSDLKLHIILIDIDENLRPLTGEEIDALEYFTDIALGFEFGNASDVTRKWIDTMHVFVNGDTSQVLMDELKMIIEEINLLVTDGFYIKREPDEGIANMKIFLGAGADYADIYGSARPYISSNWGLFFVSFDGNNNLAGANMYVDTKRAGVMAQRHLLREEFTQSLGLARDSNAHEGSIFFQSWTTTTSYIDIDRELIRLLYHPRMKSGLNRTQVRVLIASIFREQ